MDSRDIAAAVGQWWGVIDHRAMTAEWEGETRATWLRSPVAVRFEVCPTCDGRGLYVNPSIDSHGISGEEMYELGPDFMEDYRSGMYDITCVTCEGQRVVPVPTDPEVLAEMRAWQDDEAMWARVNRMEAGF